MLVLDKLRSRLVLAGPSLLSVPVKLAPFALKRQVLEQVLRWQFQQALADGELEFLEGRWLSIDVRDIGLQWFTSVENGQLIVRQSANADVSFSANASDLLMIAARKQDPDTLFFQRRLVIEGDTELGLYVKNLMDAIEPEQMPKPLHWRDCLPSSIVMIGPASDDAVAAITAAAKMNAKRIVNLAVIARAVVISSEFMRGSK